MKSMILVATLLISTSLYAAKFKYQIIEFNKFDHVSGITEKLNEMGALGSELVSVEKHMLNGSSITYRYHFKKRDQWFLVLPRLVGLLSDKLNSYSGFIELMRRTF